MWGWIDVGGNTPRWPVFLASLPESMGKFLPGGRTSSTVSVGFYEYGFGILIGVKDWTEMDPSPTQEYCRIHVFGD